MTQQPVKLQTDLLVQSWFDVSAGLDLLHILLVKGFYSIAREHVDQHLGNKTRDGHSHLMLLAYFPMTEPLQQFMN